MPGPAESPLPRHSFPSVVGDQMYPETMYRTALEVDGPKTRTLSEYECDAIIEMADYSDMYTAPRDKHIDNFVAFVEEVYGQKWGPYEARAFILVLKKTWFRWRKRRVVRSAFLSIGVGGW